MTLLALLLAEVVRVEVVSRDPFPGGYTKISGRLFYEVDPANEANARVCDLALAPRNARGRVEFWSDFVLLAPERGNGRLLYDVNNRGNKLALGAFNNRGGNDPAEGNGFLMRQGYAVLWCGWNGDVKPGDGRLQIGLPTAKNADGTPITGRIYAEMCVDQKTNSQPFAWGNTDPYPAVSEADAVLTVRPTRAAPAVEVPRDRWSFTDAKNLTLKDGFEPGKLYELLYTARDPRVTGLGLVAVRDAVSHFKRDTIRFAYGFGISQSGRFLNHFLHEGFNADEAGRIVFDGVMPHVPGAGKGLFNYRFAQTTRHGSQHQDVLYPADFFPFHSVAQTDPLTGRTGDALARSRRHLPKIMITLTSSEYWCRAASLLHTDVEGKVDAALDPNVRIYFFTGNQHGSGGSTDRGIHQNAGNPLDHRPLLRALLTALDRWVTEGHEPPPSRVPRIADGTLVDLATWSRQFPRIPGASIATSLLEPPRLDFGPRWDSEGIADLVPPKVGPVYRTLVPAVDADGNERAGVKLPDVAVPLAAYSGWNTRSAAVGAEGALGRWAGSSFPFSPAVIRERYPTREVYLERVNAAALELRNDGFLLDEDVAGIQAAAAKRNHW